MMKGKPLSPRELDVLELVWQGFTTRQIAHTLHRSFNTIAMHRQHILTKLDASGFSASSGQRPRIAVPHNLTPGVYRTSVVGDQT